MPLDANGIFKYTEQDLIGTFSTLLNKGQDSVSASLAAVKAATTARLVALETNETNWVPVDAAQGYASDMKVRRIGKIIYVTGLISSTTAQTLPSGTPVSIGTVPPGFRIVGTEYLWPAQASIGIPVNAIVNTSGVIQIRTWGPTTPAPVGVAYGIGSGWIVA